MRILIVGAAGFIGSALLAHLRAVHLVHGADLRAAGAAIERVDLTDPASMRQLLSRNWELVIVSAGMTDVHACERNPDLAYRVNVVGTRDLAQATSAKVLYLSTDYVFDGTQPWYNEDDQPRPVNVYGQSKWAAEQEVLRADAANLVVRLTFVYGRNPRRDAFLARLSAPVTRVPDATTNPLYLDDIPSALMQLVPMQGIVHLGGATVISRLLLYQRCAHALGVFTEVLPVEGTAAGNVPRPVNTVLKSRRTTVQGRALDAALHELSAARAGSTQRRTIGRS